MSAVTTSPPDAVAQRGTNGDTLITVDDLAVHFPITSGIVFRHKIGAVRAVDGLSFTVKRGETLGLVGECGCGKSHDRPRDPSAHPPDDGARPLRGRRPGAPARRRRCVASAAACR